MARILTILADTLKSSMGGMGVHALELMKHLEGVHEFVCISPDAKEMEGPNYRVFPYSGSSGFFGKPDALMANILGQTSITETIIKHGIKADLVHSHDWSTAHAGRAIARALGVPHVLTVHLSIGWLIRMFEYPEDHNTSTATAVEIESIMESDAVAHVSYEYLKRFGFFNPDRSYYFPNGIDLTAWQETPVEPVELPGRKDAKKLCYIGRYADMKNVDSLCMAELPENVDLYFIGSLSGGQEPMFQFMLDSVDRRPNTYYLGPKYGSEKVNTLRAMDAVIVPSRHEPFGIVCLEALAAGCTLLSSFESGMADYLSEDIAVRCGTTPESITEGVNKWLALTDDEIAVRRHKGFQLCQEYSWKNSANTLDQIYAEAFVNYAKRQIPHAEVMD